MRAITFSFLVCFAVIVLPGCGGSSAAGPVTIGNIVNDYPPKIRGVSVNAEASMVIVDFQPFDADVSIQGWVFVPQQGGQSRRQLNFQNSTISGKNNMTGRANFVMDGSQPINLGQPSYFLVTVKEIYFDGDQPRTAVKTYKFENGAVTPIS